MKEKPPLESRLVRTQPLTVTSWPGGTFPWRTSATDASGMLRLRSFFIGQPSPGLIRCLQEPDHVGQVLLAHAALEPVGHEGAAGAAQALQVRAQHRSGFAVQSLHRDAVARL